MSVKACAYKNCDNYVIDNVHRSGNNFTLFQFPKNPERHKQWMELGLVLPNLPPNGLFMCSDHFDKNYLSVNQRRRVLIGAAIPYAYQETVDPLHETIECQEEDHYVLVDNEMKAVSDDQRPQESLQLIGKDDNFHVESSIEEDEGHLIEIPTDINSDDNDFDECPIDDDEHQSPDNFTQHNGASRKVVISQTKKSDINYKRKNCDSPMSTSAAKIQNFKINSSLVAGDLGQVQKEKTSMAPQKESQKAVPAQLTIMKNEQSQPAPKPMDRSTLIDPQHVTTFIFKGEEYVQMALEHYLSEKTELMQKIERYESALRTLKRNIEAINFS